MVLKYACISAFVALLPAASFLLIPLELYLIYQIAEREKRFELQPFLAMGAAVVTLSGFLKGLAALLHLIPILGQLANSAVAFSFVFIIGSLAESYYQKKGHQA